MNLGRNPRMPTKVYHTDQVLTDKELERLFQALNVTAATMDKYWSVVDSLPESTLHLVHYSNVEALKEDSSVSDAEKLAILSLRGVVVDTRQGNVICRSYGYTPVYTIADKKGEIAGDKVLIDSGQVLHLENATFQRCYGGCVLRVYKYEGKIYISTHKRINTAKSTWGSSLPFPQLLLSLLKVDMDGLDKLLFTDEPSPKYTRILMVSHPSLMTESRADIGEGFVLHLDTFGEAPELSLTSPQYYSLEEAKKVLVGDLSADYRHSEGEAVVVRQSGVIYRLSPQSSGWRSALLSNNPNYYARYCQLIDYHRCREEFTEVIFNSSDVKYNYNQLFSVKYSPTTFSLRAGKDYEPYDNSIDGRIRAITYNYTLAVPHHMKNIASSYYAKLTNDYKQIITFICENREKLEAAIASKTLCDQDGFGWKGKPTPACATLSRIMTEAAKRKGKYTQNVSNLVHSERGVTLYSLIKAVTNPKASPK